MEVKGLKSYLNKAYDDLAEKYEGYFIRAEIELYQNIFYVKTGMELTSGNEEYVFTSINADDLNDLSDEQIKELLTAKLISSFKNYSPDRAYDLNTAQNYDSVADYIDDLNEAQQNFDELAGMMGEVQSFT